MGICHQRVGCLHKCSVTFAAQEALLSILMSKLYNMGTATVWAGWSFC